MSRQFHYGWLLFRVWSHNAFDIYHHHKLQCVCVTRTLRGFNNRLYIVLLEKRLSIVWKAFQTCLAGHSKWREWQPSSEHGGNDIMSMSQTGRKVYSKCSRSHFHGYTVSQSLSLAEWSQWLWTAHWKVKVWVRMSEFMTCNLI